MNAMVIDIAQQLRDPGSIGRRELSTEFDPEDLCENRLVFDRPVEVGIEFEYDGAAVNARGRINAYLARECSRCLEPFVQHLEIDFDERFSASAEEDAYPFKGDKIDISTMVRDNILLEIPLFAVCREDCRGLCTKCGCNLNYERCSCLSADE